VVRTGLRSLTKYQEPQKSKNRLRNPRLNFGQNAIFAVFDQNHDFGGIRPDCRSDRLKMTDFAIYGSDLIDQILVKLYKFHRLARATLV
jgi:hypothetical protein